MTRAALLHVLDHPTAIAPAEVRELEQLAETFPYCQTAHLLLAKAAHDQGTMLAGQRLRRAATYAADRELLRRLIEQVAPAEIPAGAPSTPADVLGAPVPTPVEAAPIVAAASPIAPTAEPTHTAAPLSEVAPAVDVAALAPVNTTGLQAIADERPATVEALAPPKAVAMEPVATAELVAAEPVAAVEEAIPTPLEEASLAPEAAPIVELPLEAAPAVELPAAAVAEELPVAAVAEENTDTTTAPPAESAAPIAEVTAAATGAVAATDETTSQAAVEAEIATEPAAEAFAATQLAVDEEQGPQPDAGAAGPVLASDNKVVDEEIVASQGPTDSELPAEILPVRPPEEAGAARLEFGLRTTPEPAPAPSYELPGLVDEWAAAATTLGLGALIDPSEPSTMALSPAAFTGDAELGYGLDGGSRLGFALQLLNSWEADDQAAATAAAQLPPVGDFFAPDVLLLAHWEAHRPPEQPTPVDLINNFLRRQPRLTRPAMLPSGSSGPQTDLSVRSTRPETELASEGLAQILVRQGKTARAIEIYERLMVKQPEKMAYFAAQIQLLQPPAQ